MRNVIRPKMPASLQRNGAKWTRELLAALRSTKPDPKLVNKLLNRYNCPDVRAALSSMYNNLCCYCEAEIAVVAFNHIEHRKPKGRFRNQTYKWGNLHLACPKCNQAKGDKWDDNKQILDAVADIPIDDHLTYDLRDVLGVIRAAKTDRGRTTIDHAGLNYREDLRGARTKTAFGVLSVIAELNIAGRSPRVSQLRLELEQKTKGQFGSLVGWLRDTYLRAA
jgi:uncharacterized protein (TIGR02646 family)